MTSASSNRFHALLSLVRNRYSDWQNLSHPTFVAEEVEGPREVSNRARDILGHDALHALVEAGEWDEMLRRLNEIGEATPLLWRQVPNHGDLNILLRADLDRPTFCLALFDLLHGSGDSSARLGRYFNYVRAHRLPDKWSFPTYFLWLCRPDSEFLVRPSHVRRLLSFGGEGGRWNEPPSPPQYAAILRGANSLRDALQEGESRPDMIEVAAFWRVAAGQVREETAPRATKSKTQAPDAKRAGPDALENWARTMTPAAGPRYDLQQLAHDTLWDETTLAFWTRALKRKGQAILHGPPGTGKTFLARHLARHLVAPGKDNAGDGFVETLQFHPSYAYEDWMQGLRPLSRPDGSLEYALVPGHFLEFCRRASEKRGCCALIVDEINRADLSHVFGELLFALEYRAESVPLSGGGQLTVPPNVLLLGTMNTSNRAASPLDPALRRRFAFFRVEPNFAVLSAFHDKTGFNAAPLIQTLEQLNRAIGDVDAQIGITPFLLPDLSERLEEVWRLEVEPLLDEAFFDRPQEREAWGWERVKGRMG